MPEALTPEDKSNFREQICLVAITQVTEQGIEKVSMRSIAKALGYTATALYSYFTNKDEIIAEARLMIFNQLSNQLDTAYASTDNLWERSRAIGDAYINFALTEPESYKLIFSTQQPLSELYPELLAAEKRTKSYMTAYIEAMVKDQLLEGDPQVLGYVFWAGMHGLIQLHMANKLGKDTISFDQLRHEMMRLITRGASTQTHSKNQS